MKNPLDYPDKNDNRRYDYSNTPYFERGEYPYICDLIPENSKIIDLGCGNGSLLKYISKRKHIQGLGIELVESGVKATIKNGFKAFIGEIDKAETYRSFKEKEFDYAICNVIIQMVM